MWLFTETGFISAVTHRDDSNKMMVRSRDRESLAHLAEFAKQHIEITLGADYAYRIVVTKSQLKKWVEQQVDNAHYDNFKNRVSKTRGYRFVESLHRVWEVMHGVEDTGRANPYASTYDADYLDDTFFPQKGKKK